MATEVIIAQEKENTRVTGIICTLGGLIIFSFYFIMGAPLNWFGWIYLSSSALLTLYFLKDAVFPELYEIGIKKVHGDRLQLFWNDRAYHRDCKGIVPVDNIAEVVLITSEQYNRSLDPSVLYRVIIKLKNASEVVIPECNISLLIVLKQQSPVIEQLRKRVTLTYVTEKVGTAVKDKEKKPIIEQFGVAPDRD